MKVTDRGYRKLQDCSVKKTAPPADGTVAGADVTEVRVELRERSYPIHIGDGLFSRSGMMLRECGIDGRICLVSMPKVFELYGGAVRESLAAAGYDVVVESVPDGEEAKSLATAELLYDRALACGLDRTSTYVALGGGVVGDVTGFVAATYMRGVPFVQMPTTLLSQVDSSVGGKVAVNHRRGKNMIGAFHQPRAVIIDTDCLETLPRRDYLAGIAEIIRYGAACDADFFAFLEEKMERLVDKESAVLQEAIGRSCAIKAGIVSADEHETTGLRSVLNFGHTFAHALEAVTEYGTWRHGEAVAIGMVCAARMAARLGICAAGDAERQEALVRAAGLPTTMGGADPAKIMAAMALDKKAEGGNVRFVLTEKIGRANIYVDISHDILEEVVSRK
jgi:3-dehydroquinate synthase